MERAWVLSLIIMSQTAIGKSSSVSRSTPLKASCFRCRFSMKYGGYPNITIAETGDSESLNTNAHNTPKAAQITASFLENGQTFTKVETSD